MLKAEIHVPGDKSISHRAIMIGALAKGETVINGFLASEDCLATVECFRKLGIEIRVTPRRCSEQVRNANRVIIKGKGLKGLKKPNGILDVGNSGTTIRLLSGILAGQPFETTITGDESIQKRPMMRIVGPLREMGAKISGAGEQESSRAGEIYVPLTICGGKLKAIEYELPVASAQVKSAILLAGLFAEGETVVIEKNPARDHTERILSYFGADIRITRSALRITGSKEFNGKEIDVPGDLSSAAFFMVAGAIMPNSELRMPNVGVNPTRTGVIDVLHRMGAKLEVQNERILSEEPRADIRITHSALRGIKISGEIIPRIIDEIPIIALAATQAQGTTEIRGAKELRVKESDRIATVSSELRKMGAKISELPDGMIIEGPVKLKGAKVKSYGDHRIAMMLSIADLVAEGKVEIDGTACIETSFPGFEGLLKVLSES